MTEYIAPQVRRTRSHGATRVQQRIGRRAQQQLWWLQLKMRLRVVREPLRGNRQDRNVLTLGMPPW